MAVNTIKITDKLAAVAADIFVETSYVAKNSVRSVEDEFGGSTKIGNSVRVKIPARYEVQSDTFTNGAVVSDRSVRSAIKQETRQLVCDQSKWIGMDLTSEELAVFTGSDAKAMKDILAQPLANLARQTDIYMFGKMANEGYGRTVLLDETKGYTTDDASLMNSILAEQLAEPSSRFLTLGTLDMHKAQVSSKGLFQSASDIAEQYKKGIVSVGQGFSSWFDSMSLPTITIGTAFANGSQAAGVFETEGAYVAGASTIVFLVNATQNGLTLKAGQALEIAGTYRLDPQTLTAVPSKFTVIVQEDKTLATGNNTVKITPMYDKVSNITLANVSALPPDAAKVTVVENLTGANSGKLAKIAIAWQKKAVAFATIDLPTDLPGAESGRDTTDGISIRVTRQFNSNTNALATIADIQFGGLVTRPEWVGSTVGFKN